MKKFLIFLFLIMVGNISFASQIEDANKWLKRAELTSIEEESYEYVIKARNIYKEEVDSNPTNIEALLGLSKTYQLTKDRSEAKLYVLKAYNFDPSSAKLQREMGDFFYSFQEYGTAIEYYKLALSSGLLRDFDTNLQSAKCYEKLGDKENAELYYKISNHLNSTSREVLNKINEYESDKKPDNSEKLEKAKYKYLFKDKPLTEAEQNNAEAKELIEKLNGV